MEMVKSVAAAIETVSGKGYAAVDGVSRWATFERILAVWCVLIPAGLIWFDKDPGVRDSISAYWDMDVAKAFYFPLTLAAMLFLVNGIVKHRGLHNIVLGIALGVIVWFDHEHSTALHFAGVGVFFVGNCLVILFFSRIQEFWFRLLMLGVIVTAAVLLFAKVLSTFWAEWISMGIIAIHFVIQSCAAENPRPE